MHPQAYIAQRCSPPCVHRRRTWLVVQHTHRALGCARSTKFGGECGGERRLFLKALALLSKARSSSMQYATEDLPQTMLDALEEGKGNWMVKNARYRRAVCEHLGLQWKSVNGSGNCFFESVCLLLNAAGVVGAEALTPSQLRLDVVRLFEICIDSPRAFCERVQAEIEFEMTQPLVCSTRAKMFGENVNRLVPGTIVRYLEASKLDGVWVTGWQWLRAISFIHQVRVGVVINGQGIVRFFGEGQKTIYLYKVRFMAQCVHALR